jgi:nitrite reductase (NADH) large subunit
MMKAKQKLVVIGNGMAGARVVEEILKRDREAFDITMFGAEPYGNYNRILLSNVLNGTQDLTEIFMNPLGWYDDNNIKLHAGVKALFIDRKSKKVVGKKIDQSSVAYDSENRGTEEGTVVEESYDKVIIATGSRPFLPPIEGYHGSGTFLFRTLDDCSRIAEYTQQCKNAAVIGGGLLGLEAARGLMTHGVKVTVLEVSPYLMANQLDEESATLLQSILEAMGIQVLCKKLATEIERQDGRVQRLQFKDGSSLETDMVVVSAGIRPITEIALESGLKVNHGILVDDKLRTSDPDVFSLGECVEHRGKLYGLVEPIWEMAGVIADVLTEKNPFAAYRGSKLGTKLKVMGVELASLGQVESDHPDDEVVFYREPSNNLYKKLIIHDNRLKGAILLGETDGFDILMKLFKDGENLPEKRSELLFGESGEMSQLVDVTALPDEAQVCNCNGVSKQQICQAIQDEGCTSVAKVGSSTKAGKGCGSCKGIIAQIIQAYAGEVAYDPTEHYYVPGVPLEKSQLIAEIKARELKSVSAVFHELAGGVEHAESKVGLASLLRSIWNESYEDERDSRFINDRVHANIQKNGTFSVVPRIFGGVTTADELIRIGMIAKKYNVPMVKLTGGQRIDLLGVKKEDLPKIWQELGIPSGHAYTKAVRTVKSCVGTDFCRFGLGNSIQLAQVIERKFQGIESPHKVKMAVAGCPRNCSEAYVKDVGVVCVEGGRFEIYVGGAAGGTVRKGDLLVTVDSAEEVIRQVGRFIQYYREHGKYMERTYGFVERVGIGRLQSVLIEDELGIAARLDGAIEEAVQSYVDPWQEADLPAYPAQFEGPELVRVLQEANNNG